MALASHRVHLLGETPYAHEREALDFLVRELPNRDPFEMWGLLHLQDPSTGRLYEIDALVLGYSALYLVEIKSGPGEYVGDSLDWSRTVRGDRSYRMDCPFSLANHKAKVLASLLERRVRPRPRVEALIFLSAEDVTLNLRADGRTGVVTRSTVVRALTHHDYPNADPSFRNEPLARPMIRDVVQAFGQIGIRPRKSQLSVSGYDLGEILGEGVSYQDRLATHRGAATIKKRARTYLVPQQTSAEVRSSLRRAADREAQLLHEVREHPSILRFNDYVPDAPLGPTVLLDDFEDGVRLDTFIRQSPDLSLEQRRDIVMDVGRALDFCHKKAVLHGGISPEAVLVRMRDGALQTRLFNFQLGSAGERVEGTVHLSSLTGQAWMAYQAPEVREDPASRSVESDVFSLGALAYFVFTGQAPAPDAIRLDERLRRDLSLDPRAVLDDIPRHPAEWVAFATALSRNNRPDDVGEWLDLYPEEPRASDEPRPALADPLTATRDELVTPDLRMVSVLGQGATSRVLRVLRLSDDTEHALKVSLGPDHDQRLRDEGEALRLLRSPYIVVCEEILAAGERPALLLSLAGTETLQRRLSQEGSIPLDYAKRWGEHLLLALDVLQTADVLHRDVKPANLGVGQINNSEQRLFLFDLSLVKTDRRALDVGTAAYRDPFLPARGAWDFAADRWGAAVTLHEMLTGIRPSWGGPGGTALDDSAPLVIASERFDPAIRDRLTRFFERALARDVERRFASAKDMDHAWAACFQGDVAEAPTSQARPEVPAPLTDERLRAIGPDTPIEALPLSPRARNALDRAGVVRASGLRRLPENRLSLVRGVGRQVIREIWDFRERWVAARPESDAPVVPFYPGYAGEDLILATTSLDDATRAALHDAGFRTLAAVATAADDQVRDLASRRAFSVKALHALLDTEHRDAEERDRPSTLESWLRALLPPRKNVAHARVLFGLDPASKADPTSHLAVGAPVTLAAERLGITTAAIYIALGKCRARWQEHKAIPDLVSAVRALLDAAGGVLALDDAATRLLATLAHDRTAPADELVRRAAALVRVVTELRAEDGETALVHAVRIGKDASRLWLASSPAYVSALRELGKTADELSSRVPLASAAETRLSLGEAVAGSPLAALPVDQLASLAARASDHAACSSRLELYPRGMPAERSIELTASILAGRLEPAEVRRRVAERYPEAAPLPDRPALDPLLERLGLRWTGEGAYERPGVSTSTMYTAATTMDRARTALPDQRLATTPDALMARELEESLASAVRRKQLRLLFVRSDLADDAAVRLSQRLGVPARPLDTLLIDAMDRIAIEKRVQPAVVHRADREGPGGKGWKNLTELAALAADRVAAELLPAKDPLLLTRPGLVARYRLRGFLEKLIEASKRDECGAILLLQPSPDGVQTAAINGELPIPGLLPGQRLSVSKEWIRNLHNAAGGTAGGT